MFGKHIKYEKNEKYIWRLIELREKKSLASWISGEAKRYSYNLTYKKSIKNIKIKLIIYHFEQNFRF